MERADAISQTAQRLLAESDEWHAVCHFYAAYRLVRAAFIEDPIFDSMKDLALIDARLALEDRYVERQVGRMDGRIRTLGVNDVVRLLYPKIAIEYRRLHAASVAVRYSEGLRVIANESVIADFATVVTAYTSGELKAHAPSRP